MLREEKMPALSRGVNPDHFANTAFNFLNPNQTSWFPADKNFVPAPDCLGRQNSATAVRYGSGWCWSAQLHSSPRVSCFLRSMCRALLPSYEFCLHGRGLELLIDATYGSWAVTWLLLLWPIAEISVGAMAQDVSMLACAQGSRMWGGTLEVYLLQWERLHMRMRIRLGMGHYYL